MHFFHYGLQVLRRRAAGVAGSVKPDLDCSVMDADQFHFGIEFAQAGSRVERLQYTGFQVVRMERIEEQQIADDWILTEFVDERLADAPDSKTISMIRSSPVPWTSIRSWTSSRAGLWNCRPASGRVRRPDAELPDFCWNSFSLVTLLLL